MAASRRKQIRDRAGDRCEYCHLPQSCTTLPHEVDHIRARKHRGRNTLQNYCWACAYCNSFKGSNAAGYDPDSDELVRLYNPRSDRWDDHFAWRGPKLVGKTPIARATIDVLRINQPDRVEHRRLLIAARLLTLG
ncbi:MAG TPA: HNH endonuclease [Gemmataceae bacterium]|jgi:5-methylcytosine-specific restriction endonuclease McrA